MSRSPSVADGSGRTDRTDHSGAVRASRGPGLTSLGLTSLGLTPKGLMVAGGAVPALLVGRLLGVAEFDLIALAALLLVVAALVTVALSGGGVTVRRRLGAGDVRVGQHVEVTLQVRVDRRLRVPLLVTDANDLGAEPDARFVLPGLGADAPATLRYDVVATRRGVAAVGPARLVVRDPFGLAQRTPTLQAAEELLVHPRVEPLDPVAARGAHRAAGDSRTRRLHTVGEDFYTMREYVHGDDLRQVHWPSTARRQRLMVRQPERSYEAQGTVLLDTRAAVHSGDGDRSTLERAISVAASLLVQLAAQGYGLRLVTDQDPVLPGPEPLGVLMGRLARMQTSATGSLVDAAAALRGGQEGLLVAVLAGSARVGTQHDRETVALQGTGRTFGDRMAVIVVDPGRRRAAEGGARLARDLDESGWRVDTLAVDAPLRPVWAGLRRSAGAAVAS